MKSKKLFILVIALWGALTCCTSALEAAKARLALLQPHDQPVYIGTAPECGTDGVIGVTVFIMSGRIIVAIAVIIRGCLRPSRAGKLAKEPDRQAGKVI